MVSAANKAIVSAYKLVGFIVLGVLLLGLLSFIGMNGFFFVSRSWVAPTVVSPSDDRVLALSGQLAHQTTVHEKLVVEQADLLAKREVAERVIAAEEAFQVQLRQTVISELVLRRAQLARFSALRDEFASRQKEIQRATDEYSKAARERLDELKKAHLVDADGYLRAGHEMAQLSLSTLELAEADTTLQIRIGVLVRDVEALHAMSQETAEGGPEAAASSHGVSLSFEVLRMKQEYARSIFDLARARSDRSVAQQGIAANSNGIEQCDRILKGLKGSPYGSASERRLTVAFVPYDNASSVVPGHPVYGCRLGFVWCRRVGRFGEMLEGEVSARHPLFSQNERGVLVRIELDEAASAESRVLFAGAPLIL